MKKIVCIILIVLSFNTGNASNDSVYCSDSTPDTLSQYYRLPMFNNMVELNPAIYNKYFYWPYPVFTIIENKY